MEDLHVQAINTCLLCFLLSSPAGGILAVIASLDHDTEAALEEHANPLEKASNYGRHKRGRNFCPSKSSLAV